MRWLTIDGSVAALVVGALVVGGLGWRGAVLLLAFFISGSLLTQLTSRKTSGWVNPAPVARGYRQVLANGGVAALAAAFGSWSVAAGALSAAAADTWATEIGAFSPSPPRLITTGAPVARGVSGGITVLGTIGGVMGALFIALIDRQFAPPHVAPRALLIASVGIAGMLVDSLAGATVQARGWLDNDAVNVVATVTGAALAFAFS